MEAGINIYINIIAMRDRVDDGAWEVVEWYKGEEWG